MKAINIPVRKTISPPVCSGVFSVIAHADGPQSINTTLTRSVVATGGDLDFDIPNGSTLRKVGEVVNLDGKRYRCESISASNATFRNVKNYGEIIHLSNCRDKGDQKVFSTSEEVRSQVDSKPKQTGTTEKTMAKKETKEKRPGKIAFVDAVYLKGGSTKAEIAEALSTSFKVPIKTAKNTVSWCASTFDTRNKGKTPKFETDKESAPKSKPAAKKKTPAKKPATTAKKKTPSIPKRKAPVVKAEPESTPAPVESDATV